MNIDYHYYTIKTLAHYAGFNEEAAQRIAHFSQYVDDFIMSSLFLVDKEPPSFFMRNNLAKKCGKDFWAFYPCPTGISILCAVSHGYQLHTLMPFHFIMTKPYNSPKSFANRSEYRCATANESEDLLINQLAVKAVQNASVDDNASLTALGMVLHTFADTYSHYGYSGFHGWENQSLVVNMTHNQTSSKAMNTAEIIFYSSLPSIGHDNVRYAPDLCDCSIEIKAKKTAESGLTTLIKRNNAEFFSDCSKRILSMLRQVTKQPFASEEEWELLKRKLMNVHNIKVEPGNKKEIQKNWEREFPDIQYYYDKNEYFKVGFDLLYHDDRLTSNLNIDTATLTDMHSEEGDQARAANLLMAKALNNDFYTFNELAYRHVYATVGKYVSEGSADVMDTYCNMVNEAL